MDDIQFSYTDQARLDWYAANAPEPPEWFVGPVNSLPERPDFEGWPTPECWDAWKRLTGGGEISVDELFEDDVDQDIEKQAKIVGADPLDVRAGLERKRSHEEAVAQWEQDKAIVRHRNQEIRFFAWRRYYAEQMLRTMNEADPRGPEGENPPVIVCDLDNTIAIDRHRARFIEQQEPPDWEAYHLACGDDEPNWPLINALRTLQRSHEIWILTGRMEYVADITREWLQRHGVPYNTMLMRPEGDYQPGSDLKRQWLHDYLPRERIEFVLEDADSVVTMWRNEGLPCFQVAEANW